MLTSWFVPHRILNFGWSDPGEHRALQTLIALFRGPIVILDSTLAGDHFFRRGLRRDIAGTGDGFFRDLVQNGFVRVAMRERDGRRLRLRETAEAVEQRAGPLFPPDRKDDDVVAPELEYVEQRGEKLWFSEEEYRLRYQREIEALFARRFRDDQLPEPYREAILRFVQEKAEAGTGVTWTHFRTDELWHRLESVSKTRGDGDVRTRYGAFVFALARGPAVTFLPSMPGIDPMFSEEDQLAIDLWKGRDPATELVIACRTVPAVRLTAADFVNGLSLLTADDVLELCRSDEHGAYQAALRTKAERADDTTLDDAVSAYRRRIESVVIARGAPAAREQTTETRQTSIVRTVAAGVVTETVKCAVLAALDQFSGIPISLIPAGANAGYEALRKRHDIAAAEERGALRERDRQRLSDDLVIRALRANERQVPVHLLDAPPYEVIDSPAARRPPVDTLVDVSLMFRRVA